MIFRYLAPRQRSLMIVRDYKTWRRQWQESFSANLLNWWKTNHHDKCKQVWWTLKRCCRISAVQQIQQWQRLFAHYKQFYNGCRQNILTSYMFQKFHFKRPPICILAGAACSFSWEDNGITNEQIFEQISQFKMLENQKVTFFCQENEGSEKFVIECEVPPDWELILDGKNIKIWRLPFENTEFMQYKVFGTFTDVTPRQFYMVQTNLEYRKAWDELALDISVIDENVETGEQVLRWISRFPYPFNAREYVYIRRAKKVQDSNVMAIIARSIDHPNCKQSSKYVRVPLYVSNMIIKPHTSIDEPGLDYLLTYCDDPRTSLPSTLSSWVVTAGIPEYLEKIHKAALNLNKHQITDVNKQSNSSLVHHITDFDSNRSEISV